MRRLPLHVARALLLLGPVAVAFSSGGFFTEARLVVAIGAWVCLALALVGGAGALGGSRGGRVPVAWALGGLALFTGWTALAGLWSPVEGGASDALERCLLYLGTVAAATSAFAPRPAARVAEVALAAGTLVAVGYGLAGRLVPDLIHVTITRSSGGRLDQPLTYWNAEGALAALGFVLCVRIAGDRTRPLALRCAATAAAVPLGLGVYLTFSRGALSALGVGLAVLVLLAPTWAQVRSLAIAFEGAAVAVFAAALLDSVRNGSGSAAQGAAMLAVLVVAMAAAALLQRWSARSEDAGSTRDGALPRELVARRVLAVAAIVFFVLPFAGAAIGQSGDGGSDPAFGATTKRFGSVESKRFDYWQAALRGFADAPVAGRGAGSFPSIWLEHRDIPEQALDAHSLEVETLAELGLVGLFVLLGTLLGFAAASRRAWRADPVAVAGPIAALALWTAHSAIDWDWEMPGLTLPAAVLAGLVLGRAARATSPA